MILLEKGIFDNKNQIGYVCILTYPNMGDIPFLQYEVASEYRNKGVVSQAVRLFLIECKNKGYNQILAMCEDNNIASMRILMKNNFIEYTKIRNIACYLTDLRHDKNSLNKILKKYNGNGVFI
jgi:RimJ/RimL family protein N-acetyltransferase